MVQVVVKEERGRGMDADSVHVVHSVPDGLFICLPVFNSIFSFQHPSLP